GIESSSSDTISIKNVNILSDIIFQDGSNRGIDTFSAKNASIENANIHNYFIGIASFFSDTISVDNVNILLGAAFQNLSCHGINTVSAKNVSIKNANIHNYFVGIESSSSDTISVDNVNILSDTIFQDGSNRGI